MFHNILLCTDGSDQALNAVHFGADLAVRHGARVDLVNVVDPVIVTGPSFLAPETGISEVITLDYAKEGQQALLQTAGKILEEANVPYQSHAELGNTIDRITCVAEQAKSDLIVIGSRGLSAWPVLLLGSVSEGVAQHASCPVLIVRGKLEALHQIVMASDGSEPAVHAAKAGIQLAHDYGAEVTVVNVFHPFDVPAEQYAGRFDLSYYSARIAQAIAAQITQLADESGVSYHICQLQGHTAESVVEYSEKQHADLIVLGSRGLGGFKRLLLGSVSRSVLHHAHCSVLIVR